VKTQSETGVLYVATGPDYIEEANWASRSAKQHGLQTALFCDDAEAAASHFDYVFPLDDPKQELVDKIEPLLASPFERTLFLDTDTFILNDLGDLFSILDAFDIAYAHAPIREHVDASLDGIPKSFVQPNTGVILYRNEEKMESMVRDWLRIYRRQLQEQSSPPNDQPAFKKAVYESNLRPYILPPALNVRVDKSRLIGGNITAKILHARPEIIQREMQKFRRESIPMVTLHVNSDQELVRNFGVWTLLRASAKELVNRVMRRVRR